MTLISIPAPADPSQFQSLGFLYLNYQVVHTYWRRVERQVLFKRGNFWFLQADGSIRKSLSLLMDCLERDIVTVALSLFERGQFVEADPDMKNGFLNCEWSDFASDYMIINVYIQHRTNAPHPETIVIRTPTIDDILITPPRIHRLPFY